MKQLGLMIVAAAVCAMGQTVSGVHFDGVGDSSARVIFNVSSTFNAMRVRYGTGSCAGGGNGTVQGYGTSSSTFRLFEMTANISGLAPATQYYVCPEVSSNGGSSWSSGVAAPFTTLARTQVLPLAPLGVDTTFPTQSGATLNVSADCSDLQAKMNAAVPGDTILIPSGTVCTGSYLLPTSAGARTFVSSAVRTSDSRITLAGHGFSENQEVRVSAGAPNGDCLPGMAIYPNGLNCEKGGGWRKGGRYWVHAVDADHVQLLDGVGGSPVVPGYIVFSCNAGADSITFAPGWQSAGGFRHQNDSGISANTAIQMHSSSGLCGGLSMDTTYYLLSGCASSGDSACTTQVSAIMGGSPVDITSAGTGVHKLVDRGSGTMYIGPANHTNDPWIVIRPAGAIPPPGVRTTPGFDAGGYHFRQLTPVDNTPRLQTGILAHNWRIVGAIFDTATNTDYLTTTDPRPYCGVFRVGQDASNILLDQIRVQGPGYPNRFGCSTAMFLDGENVGIINSDLRGMDYWHPWRSGGVVTRQSNSQVTATSGVIHGGAFTTTLTGTTILNTTGGSATGTGYAYFKMDGALEFQLPAGTTGNCSATGTMCTVTTSASPGWPVNAQGRTGGFKWFTLNFSGGNITAATETDGSASVNNSEGSQSIIAGNGPGPYVIDNNYISGTGIPLHFDDSGGAFLTRSDYTVTRNTFDTPRSQDRGDPQSDGLTYGHRQPLEWKGGTRIKVDGNIFTGHFAEVSSNSVNIAFTPRSGGDVTDVDVTNNSFLNTAGGSNIASPIDSNAPVSKPAARQRFRNNMFLSMNGWAGSIPGVSTGHGWPFFGGYAAENITIDHNTIYDNRGANPALLHWIGAPVGGFKITSNIYFYSGNAPAIQGENVANCNGADKALMDCAFTLGPGTPGYVFARNVLVPSWANTAVPSGFVGGSTVQDAFPSPLVNYVPSGGSVAAVLNTVRFANSAGGSAVELNAQLAANSPYRNNAADGTQVGANVDQLLQAQSRILQMRATSVDSTSATITAFTPVAGSLCYAGRGTSNIPSSWTWSSPDSAPTRQRNITMSGLSSGMQYFYSLVCEHSALPSIETFRTP